MPPPRPDIVRRAYDAFAARDVEALVGLADEGVEVRTITGVLAERDQPYRGHDGVRRYIADVGRVWDELELVPGEFHELDERRVLVFGRVRGRRGATRIDSPNAWLWELRGERVVAITVFGDPATARSLLAGG